MSANIVKSYHFCVLLQMFLIRIVIWVSHDEDVPTYRFPLRKHFRSNKSLFAKIVVPLHTFKE